MNPSKPFAKTGYLKSLSLVTAGLFLSQASEFAKDIVIAWRYGATRITDAFLCAFSLPFLLYSVLLIACPLVLVPRFSELKAAGKSDEISTLYSRLFWLISPLLGIVAVAISVFHARIIRWLGPGLLPEADALAQNALSWLAWAILPAGLIALTASLLRGCGFFLSPHP